ncbi:hypothetical protein PAPHI01_2107 [Pancytospora philotis]|nr:hypothetical protein PAPHI01_2107 [Pancytospora philotis]
MSSLFVVVNENSDIIFKHTLDAQGSERSPLMMLIAYASLDAEGLDGFEDYAVRAHRCITGHRLILVGKEFKSGVKKFLAVAETALAREIQSVHTDDSTWLRPEFASVVDELWGVGSR